MSRTLSTEGKVKFKPDTQNNLYDMSISKSTVFTLYLIDGTLLYLVSECGKHRISINQDFARIKFPITWGKLEKQLKEDRNIINYKIT